MELLVERYTRRTVDIGKEYELRPEWVDSDVTDVRGAVDALKKCLGTSADRGSIRPAADTLTGDEWAVGELFETGRNGNVFEQESVHVSFASGRRLSGRQLARLFKAAGLISIN